MSQKTRFGYERKRAEQGGSAKHSRRDFLKLLGLSAAGKVLGGCETNYYGSEQDGACPTLGPSETCYYESAEGVRCKVWDGETLPPVNGYIAKVTNIRREGTEKSADVDILDPALSCRSIVSGPMTTVVPGVIMYVLRGDAYSATVHYSEPAENTGAGLGWADVEFKRENAFCDWHVTRETLGEGGELKSQDEKVTLRVKRITAEPERALVEAYDSGGALMGQFSMLEGDVRSVRQGDNVYVITAHVVVHGDDATDSCADISIATCSVPITASGIVISS